MCLIPAPERSLRISNQHQSVVTLPWEITGRNSVNCTQVRQFHSQSIPRSAFIRSPQIRSTDKRTRGVVADWLQELAMPDTNEGATITHTFLRLI